MQAWPTSRKYKISSSFSVSRRLDSLFSMFMHLTTATILSFRNCMLFSDVSLIALMQDNQPGIQGLIRFNTFDPINYNDPRPEWISNFS